METHRDSLFYVVHQLFAVLLLCSAARHPPETVALLRPAVPRPKVSPQPVLREERQPRHSWGSYARGDNQGKICRKKKLNFFYKKKTFCRKSEKSNIHNFEFRITFKNYQHFRVFDSSPATSTCGLAALRKFQRATSQPHAIRSLT